MAFFNYPFHVTKDTPAIASEVQTNFDQLLAWVLANLIQKDGTVAMTGPLVLAPGDPGAPGHAANKAYVDAQLPVGMMTEFAGTALPAGWLWCNGDTYTNTSQQSLAAAIGRTYTAAAVPTGSFQVPDMRKRSPVGYDATEVAVYGLGVKGGQRNSELLSHQHANPAHEHVIQEIGHSASGWTGGGGGVDHLHGVGSLGMQGAGQHGHNWGSGTTFLYFAGAGAGGYGVGGGSGWNTATFSHDGNHAHTMVGQTGASDRALDHNHPIGVSVANHPAFWTNTGTGNTTSGLTGAGTTLVDKNLPPYTVVNYIIYAGKS